MMMFTNLLMSEHVVFVSVLTELGSCLLALGSTHISKLDDVRFC